MKRINSPKDLLIIAFLLLGGISNYLAAQKVVVDVNLDVHHKLGNISEFDRSKFIQVHSDLDDGDWEGGNFTSDLRADFLTGYDVYMGRNTGGMQWNMNGQVAQDPARTGYAKPTGGTNSIEYFGSQKITSYASETEWHKYEFRNNQILAAQLHPFWPDGQTTSQGWAFSQTDTPSEPFGTASGEYYGRYLQEFYRTGGTTGPKKPLWAEVVNEPVWHLVDYGDTELSQIFKFHNTVASEIKDYNPDMLVGGYCTAFPDFDKHNFQQWEDRWMTFMDSCGANMDFWSIHLYDFPSISSGQQRYRKGSNMEATMDMMEQYSYIKFGIAKPFVVSEFGAQMHDYFGLWSHYRDWLHVKSVNSMMMQFMERANIIGSALNFLPLKAEWGNQLNINRTYNHRLLRKENEPDSFTGTYVYSDMVQNYQLWADVNGIRIDTRSDNPDILTDGFVNGDTAYLIINNLLFEDINVDIQMFGTSNNIESVKVMHNYLTGAVRTGRGVIDEETLSAVPTDLTLGAEGTMILQYIFDNTIIIGDTSKETKYYADAYYKPIVGGSAETFNINGVAVDKANGEAILRVGMGRDHGASLQPTVTVNGEEVPVPANYRGGPQTDRDNFFGVIEIPVPYRLIEADNEITVEYDQSGGHISSVAMQVYEFSKNIPRSTDVSGVSLYPEDSVKVGVTQVRQITEIIYPATAIDKSVSWASTNESIVTIDSDGKITGVLEGMAKVYATTTDGGFTDTCVVTVQTARVDVIPEIIKIVPDTAYMFIGDSAQFSVTILPEDPDEDSILWKSLDESFATIDSTGLLRGVGEGDVSIVATAYDGGVTDTIDVRVVLYEPPYFYYDDNNKYLTTIYVSEDTLEITGDFFAGTDASISGDVTFWLREITPPFAVVNDYTVTVSSANGENSGEITGKIPLTGVPASDELPADNFYFIWVNFSCSDGAAADSGLFPITIVNPASFEYDNESKYLNTKYPPEGTLEVIGDYYAGYENTVEGSINFALQEVTSSGILVNVYTVTDASSDGQEGGTASGEIDIDGITTSVDLPTGNKYILVTGFTNSDGLDIENTLSPITIEIPSDISTVEINVTIYPNPVKDKLTIEGLEQAEYSIVIYNMQGVECHRSAIEGLYSIEIPTVDLPNGIYILNVSNSVSNSNYRFTKVQN